MPATTVLSSKGQLVIPQEMRKALHLRSGDRLTVTKEGSRLVLEPVRSGGAKLIRRNGRSSLVAPEDAPPMTMETIKEALNDFP
jgi:AbrB family looped-hinge helix DNA binding protein